METAIQLVQTGHLCIFTLHASNAVQAIDRMINYKRHQILMALALNMVGIIGQRLVITQSSRHRAITDLLLNAPTVQDLILKEKS